MPLTPEELEQILDEFLDEAPDVTSFLSLVPHSQASVIAQFAFDHAKRLSTTIGLPLPPATLLTEPDDFVDSATIATFAMSHFTLSAGYWLTQYAFTRRFNPVPVDFETLKKALDDCGDISIDAVLSVRLDHLLSRCCERIILPQIRMQIPGIVEAIQDDPAKQESLQLSLYVMLTVGSWIWQTADSLAGHDLRRNIDSEWLFISYSSTDKRKVHAIAKALEEDGFTVWLDEKHIAVGEPILDRLREGILNEVDFVLVFMSKSSVDSEWVKHEIRLAYQRELESGSIVVLPILLTDCEVPKELKIKKYLDARPSAKKAARFIADAIRQHRKVWRRPKKKMEDVSE